MAKQWTLYAIEAKCNDGKWKMVTRARLLDKCWGREVSFGGVSPKTWVSYEAASDAALSVSVHLGLDTRVVSMALVRGTVEMTWKSLCSSVLTSDRASKPHKGW